MALLGAAAVAAATVVAFSRVDLSLPSGPALAAACGQVVPFQSGVAMVLTLVLAGAGFVVLVLALRSAARQFVAQRRTVRSAEAVGRRAIGGHAVTVISNECPRAYCAGLVRPRIYVSLGALRTLSRAELEAVIAHEAHHRAKRDPLRIFMVGVITDALFFLPGLRRLGRRYRELAELAADEAATRSTDAESLASALLAFGSRGGEVGAVVGIAPERVDHLLGQTAHWQLPRSVFAGFLATTAALAGAVIGLPTLAGSGSLALAALLAQGCMVAMVAVPVAALALLALTFRRTEFRRAGA